MKQWYAHIFTFHGGPYKNVVDSERYQYSATAFHISGFMDSLPSCHHHLLTSTNPNIDPKVSRALWKNQTIHPKLYLQQPTLQPQHRDLRSPQLPKMASEIDIYNQYPLHMDPATKALSLPHPSAQTPSQTAAINTELQELNQLHRALISLDPPNIPPAPLPINPKRSAQISKLRDSANAAHRKSNYEEAIKLYSYAIDMALSRPGWEPVGVAREELSGLYANRAQAQMALQAWPEALVDAKASVDSKPVANVKAWWRIAKCLAEMSRYEEARKFLHKSLDMEGKDSEGGKELFALLGEVDRALLRGLSA